MAWTCVRCRKKIFKPREGAYKYALEWRYVKSRGELLVEMRKLSDLKDRSVVTHLTCHEASEYDGFETRLKMRLGIPEEADHPLLV